MKNSPDPRPWLYLYKTAAWLKLRRKHLKKEPLCRFCLKNGIVTPANTVDHVKAHKGNVNLFFDANNLCSLCDHCHDSVKQKIEKSGEYGCDSDGIVPAWRN